MKKKVFIIGNDQGLPGVKKDIVNYKNFFKSPFGGSWLEEEIIVKINPIKKDLLFDIERLKFLQLDFIVIIYSGHGGHIRETVLEINPFGEMIIESELKNIASRQITILDCCRSYAELISEELRAKTVSETITDILVRQKYDRRILIAIPQQVSLYACSIGEIANDTNEGGAYSKNLIPCSFPGENEFKLLGNAHQEASKLTQEEFIDQHPDAILPKCLSSQQLIIGINPKY
jgi:hypothetical protein